MSHYNAVALRRELEFHSRQIHVDENEIESAVINGWVHGPIFAEYLIPQTSRLLHNLW